MSIRVVERGIAPDDGGHGEVGVRSQTIGRDVIVRWFCGDKRTFEPDDVRTIVACLDVISDFPEMWLQATDIQGRDVYLIVVDEKLYANTEPAKPDAGIDWQEMKKVLGKAIK